MNIEHIPGYLAGADSDPLMVAVVIVLIVASLLGGVSYFKLHAVPEHIAHGKNHSQLQLITVLTILALFTHINFFWVAALVLAIVEIPDFLSPLKSIANSLESIAKGDKTEVQPEVQPEAKDNTNTQGES